MTAGQWTNTHRWLEYLIVKKVVNTPTSWPSIRSIKYSNISHSRINLYSSNSSFLAVVQSEPGSATLMNMTLYLVGIDNLSSRGNCIYRGMCDTKRCDAL